MEGFVRNPQLSLCCSGSSCRPNMAAGFRTFRAGYWLWHSEWSKLRVTSARYPFCMLSLDIYTHDQTIAGSQDYYQTSMQSLGSVAILMTLWWSEVHGSPWLVHIFHGHETICYRQVAAFMRSATLFPVWSRVHDVLLWRCETWYPLSNWPALDFFFFFFFY